MSNAKFSLFLHFVPSFLILGSSVGVVSGGVKVEIQVPRCCGDGAGIFSDQRGLGCYNYSQNSPRWKGIFYDKDSKERLSPDQEAVLSVSYRHKLLSCQSAIPLTANFTKNYKLMSDGSVLRHCRKCPCKKWIPLTGEFCIDGVSSETLENSSNSYRINYSGSEDDQIILVCPVNKTNETKSLKQVFLYSFFGSSIFSLLIVFVYILLWEEQSLHGWSVFGLVLSRFCFSILIGLAYLFDINGYQHQTHFKPTCKAIGMLAHFFTLSSFTWLAVLCFDIWVTFSSMNPVPKTKMLVKEHFYYAAFAIGLPFAVVSTSIILNEQYKGASTEFWIPDYGDGVCFVTKCARGIYVYSIIGTLLTFSSAFFFLTILKLYRLRKTTESLLQNRSKPDITGFVLYGKLGLLMGVTWIMELISWAITPEPDFTSWYWLPIDVFNVFISAVLIFIMLICQKKILDQLSGKYDSFRLAAKFVSQSWISLSGGSSVQTPTTNSTEANSSKPVFP